MIPTMYLIIDRKDALGAYLEVARGKYDNDESSITNINSRNDKYMSTTTENSFSSILPPEVVGLILADFQR